MEKVKQLQDQFKINNKLEKTVKNMTDNKELVSLTFTVNGDRLVAFGNSKGIDNLKDIYNTDSAKLKDLLHTVQQCLTKPRLEEKSSFKTTNRVNLPKIGCQFRGRHWTEGKCRAYTQLGLLLFGFGLGGDKSYKLEFIPEWWPDGVDFVSFVGPSNASKIQNEAILEAMYASVGLDINTYHDRDDSPVREKKKTKKTVKAPVENETDNMDSDDLGEEMEEEQRLNFFATQSSSPKMSKRLSVVETLVIQEESQEIEPAQDSSDASNSRDISAETLENALALQEEKGSQPVGEEEDIEDNDELLTKQSEEAIEVGSKSEKRKSLDDSGVITFETSNRKQIQTDFDDTVVESPKMKIKKVNETTCDLFGSSSFM